MRRILLVLLVCLTNLAAGQRVEVLHDVNVSTAPSPPSFPESFARAGNVTVIVAEGPGIGRELFLCDEAAGTLMPVDIWPGPNASNIHHLVSTGIRVFFVASDGVRFQELWTTDGTQSGTYLVKVIDPASPVSSSLVNDVTAYAGRAWFTANDGIHGKELWTSDGTPAGTFMVHDIGLPNGSPDESSFPQFLTDSGGMLYFTAISAATGRELWVTDGSSTSLVADVNPGPASSDPAALVDHGGALHFAGTTAAMTRPLMRTTGSGFTVLPGLPNVDGVNTGGSTNPSRFVSSGPNLYLKSSGEVFVWDGSSFTQLTSFGGLPFDYAAAVGSGLFFTVNDFGFGHGNELYATDGLTPAQLVLDIFPGPGSAFGDHLGSDFSESFVAFQGRLFFEAQDGVHGHELWVSDGTSAGTFLFRDCNPGGGHGRPHVLREIGGALHFSATDGVHGAEYWKSDGTAGGTLLFKDVWAAPGGGGTGDSDPEGIAVNGGIGLFSAFGAFAGRELWRTDGTPGGTFFLKDLNPTAGSDPSELFVFQNAFWFTADDGLSGRELWTSDGTGPGTAMFLDLYPGPGSGDPRNFIVDGTTAWFVAWGGGPEGFSLWKSDGTPAGTVLVKDVDPTSLNDPISNMIAIGGLLYFSAEDGTNGTELWVSDGTAAGTQMLKDIRPGPLPSYPQDFAAHQGLLFFEADNGMSGTELWVSDGTTAGTRLVKDVNPGPASSFPNFLQSFQGTLFFAADDGMNGREWWTSDGTAAGTGLFLDLNPAGSSSPRFPVEKDGRLFFNANDGTNGAELWATNGTPAGTLLIADINPGAGSSDPIPALAIGSRYLVLTATTDSTGDEVWLSDGTASGTFMVADVFAGPAGSFAYDFAEINGRVYFGATNQAFGREPFAILDLASAFPFAAGCGSGGRVPSLSATDPFLGGSAIFTGADAFPGAIAYLFLSLPATPLPLGGGCVAYVSPLGFIATSFAAPSSWTFGIPVPNEPLLLNVEIAAQVLYVGTPSGFEVSNPLLARLGR